MSNQTKNFVVPEIAVERDVLNEPKIKSRLIENFMPDNIGVLNGSKVALSLYFENNFSILLRFSDHQINIYGISINDLQDLFNTPTPVVIGLSKFADPPYLYVQKSIPPPLLKFMFAADFLAICVCKLRIYTQCKCSKITNCLYENREYDSTH